MSLILKSAKAMSIYFFVFAALISGVYLYYSELEGQPIPIGQKEKKSFREYWYQNKAEINRYSLIQARYGSLHQGHSILIFVTEDFLTDKKVKNETYSNKNSVRVLKLNFIRKFITGIYDYSTMLSTHTPVDLSRNTIKVSLSSQEWCGHVYSHLELDKREYEFTSHSYFEKEVLEEYDLDAVNLEDEMMVKIRISPDSLPLDNIRVIPSLLYSRLSHHELKEEEAFASVYRTKDSDFNKVNLVKSSLMTYEIKYKNIGRLLKIIYAQKFPYQIVGFIEEHPSSDRSGKKLISKAVLTHSILTKYWSENQPQFIHLRKKLGL